MFMQLNINNGLAHLEISFDKVTQYNNVKIEKFPFDCQLFDFLFTFSAIISGNFCWLWVYQYLAMTTWKPLRIFIKNWFWMTAWLLEKTIQAKNNY